MQRILVLILFMQLTMVVRSQSCSEMLSLAEENYRNGQFNNIKPELCKCFGIHFSVRSGEIKPKSYRLMIDEMKKAEAMYPAQLGSFKSYSEDFIIPDSVYKLRQRIYFSDAERRRAFILLGKVYYHLGVLSLAEYFAVRSIMLDPGTPSEDADVGYNRIYDRNVRSVAELSAGPVIGWLYSLPVQIKNNAEGLNDFKYQTDGKILLGGQFNYFFKPSLILNLNFWFHGLRVVYTQSKTSSTENFDFYLAERQNWIKFPVLIKWSPGSFNQSNASRPKIFICPGFSLNYMTEARATMIDVVSNTTLNNYNVSPYRNRFNYEVLLQLLARFRLGQNYLNAGFTGAYTIKEIVNQHLVGASDNPLYTKYGIKENNYKLLSGAWYVSYEFRFSYRKKKNSLF